MSPDLIAALVQIIKRVEADQPSGLLDRQTIRAKDELRVILSRIGVKVDQ